MPIRRLVVVYEQKKYRMVEKTIRYLKKKINVY